MTLIIPKPTGAKLTLGKTWQPMDPDAAAYITAVETADGQSLEEGVKRAIDNFVLGCKEDGIWSAIKASCILAGARTLAGCLVPLVGTAPTNFNFVAGDYNRKTGLVGNGSSKYLNSNRNINADPQNNMHQAVYVATAATTSSNYGPYIGGGTGAVGACEIIRDINNGGIYTRNQSSTAQITVAAGNSTGLLGQNRNNSVNYTFRYSSTSIQITFASQSPFNGNHGIYASVSGPYSLTDFINARLSFYSIGESLDLAKLDSRVTDLMTALGAAIP